MSQQSRWNAGLYDDKHSFVYKMAEGLLDLLAAQANENILDIGCGTGHLTAKIAAIGAKITGIDRSPEMIRQAREVYPHFRFEVADATNIATDQRFDAVFSNATLHWIKEPGRVVREVARLLKPDGRFVAEFGGHGNIAKLVGAAERAWLKLQLPSPVPNPWYYPSIPEYAAVLEEHGLMVTYAILFDRPTPLEDGENGLKNWLLMFGGAISEKLPGNERNHLIEETVREGRPELFHEGRWVIDYRRLRIVAKKRIAFANSSNRSD
jgi:trans-aconitate methyltransferase